MSNGFRLVSGPTSFTSNHMTRLLVRLAIHGPVRWIACGHFMDLQSLIYQVALRGGSRTYAILQENIAIARAETCYQVAAALRRTGPGGSPTLVSDLLVPFSDVKLKDEEALVLLKEGLEVLDEMSTAGPVMVSAANTSGRPSLQKILHERARRIVQAPEEEWYGA